MDACINSVLFVSGLIGYSETIDVVHNFGTLRTRVDAMEAISEMEQSDFTTSMVENAINYINTQMFQPEYVRPNNGRNKVIVFLTHSRSEDIQLVFSESMDAKLQGLHVIAVPLGSDINMEEIRGLVTHPPEGNIIRANDIRNLIRSYQTELRDMICNGTIFLISIAYLSELLYSLNNLRECIDPSAL